MYLLGDYMSIVMHIDNDNFYASVEELYHPEYRDYPMAVGGDAELRHGIVLSKNQKAKMCGVKTGEAIWQAKNKCGNLIAAKSHPDLYQKVSRKEKALFAEYSGFIQSGGIDESWMQFDDIDMDEGVRIANEIRERSQAEIGVTVSIGVSFNKIFAKLGSDQNKPNGIYVITEDNFKETVWPLPARKLYMVGPRTQEKMLRLGIYTIGDIAKTDVKFIRYHFNKPGVMLWGFANGLPLSPVAEMDYDRPEKSVGNSTTTPRNLVCEQDAFITFSILAQSVASRLFKAEYVGDVVSIYVRDSDLCTFTRQHKIPRPTQLTDVILDAAMNLFKDNYGWHKPIRSLGVRVSNLSSVYNPIQISMFDAPIEDGYRGIEELHLDLEKKSKLEKSLLGIRSRFGNKAVRRCTELIDRGLSALDAETEHTIHPEAFAG